MRILYLDCTCGVSGDMALNALIELGGCRSEVEAAMAKTDLAEHEHHHGSSSHDDHKRHSHPHSHGRSYSDVKAMIASAAFSDKAKQLAIDIYGHIAEAEAQVHGESLETIHFHEVGRDEAIKNALGIGMAVEMIAPDTILVSDICDGKGAIVCSHGEIPVPVPAVKALMKRSSFTFRQTDVNTELVTPSGLAAIMGIGAEPAANAEFLKTGNIIAETEAKGARDTGLGGLKGYIIEVQER